MISPNHLANPKYGVLYVPTIAYLYLWSLPSPRKFQILSLSIPNPDVYPLFAGIGFVGAILAQNLFEAIFGPGGPEENPKYTTTALLHSYALLTNVDPEQISESEMVSNVRSIQEISHKVSVRKAIRGLLLVIPIYGLRVLMIYSIFILFYYIWVTDGDFLLALLLLGTITMFVQKYISSLFPEVGSLESAEWRDTPEYKRYEKRVHDDRDLE